MRTALCLTGHLRKFELVWPSLRRHVVDRWQPDIFGFTWTDSFGEYMHRFSDAKHASQYLGYDPGSPPVPLDMPAGIARMIGARAVATRDGRHMAGDVDQLLRDYAQFERAWPYHRPRGKYQMMLGRRECVRLKQAQEQAQGWTYDRVIFSRWDVAYDLALPDDIMQRPELVMPWRYSYDGPCDIWAVGNSAQIDAYAGMIDALPAVCQTAGFTTHPHQWLRDNLNHHCVAWSQDHIKVSIFNRPYAGA
jgi:hypothetical protein